MIIVPITDTYICNWDNIVIGGLEKILNDHKSFQN